MNEGDEHGRGLSGRPRCNQGAKRSGSATARIMAKSPAGSVHSRNRRPAAGKQQDAAAAQAIFVAVLGVDRRAFGEPEAAGLTTLNATSRVATRWISMRDRMSFQRASWRNARPDVAVELAVDAVEEVEGELGRHAFRVVVGGDQPLDPLDPVHADQQPRARAEQRAELAQEVGRAPRHEIADRRAGEEAEPRQMLDAARQARTAARSRRRPGLPRSSGSLLQLGRAVLEIIAGNVDRDVCCGRDRFEQDRGLGLRSGAELDDRRALGTRSRDSA